MARQFRFFAFLALVLVVVCGGAGRVHAQATDVQADRCAYNSPDGMLPDGSPGINQTAGSEQQYISSVRVARAHDQSYAQYIGQVSVKQLDAMVDFCFGRLADVFSQMALLADPLNIIGNYINSQIANLVMQALQSVCSFADSLNAAQLAALSHVNVCLPLPTLNLNINTDFNIPTKPCNGTKVFGVGMAYVPRPPAPQTVYDLLMGQGGKK